MARRTGRTSWMNWSQRCAPPLGLGSACALLRRLLTQATQCLFSGVIHASPGLALQRAKELGFDFQELRKARQRLGAFTAATAMTQLRQCHRSWGWTFTGA